MKKRLGVEKERVEEDEIVNFEFSNYFLGNMHGKFFKSLSDRGPRMFVVLI